MYERFTDRSRRVMQLANQEAQRFNHEYVDDGHLLIALIKEGQGIAATCLRSVELSIGSIRETVEKLNPSGPDMVTMGKLPFTPTLKRVIHRAFEEAKELAHDYIGTEHLLLGILNLGREEVTVANSSLVKLGVDIDTLKKYIVSLLLPQVEKEQVGLTDETLKKIFAGLEKHESKMMVTRKQILLIHLLTSDMGRDLTKYYTYNMPAVIGALRKVTNDILGE